MGKLFCTFCIQESLDTTLETIQDNYNILNKKIFVLEIEENNEYVCTYNIDEYNVTNSLIPGTILTHRNKSTNTLYTINAINALIKQLNNNKLDPKFPIKWEDYKNNILLTRNNEFHKLGTKLYKIVSL